MTIFSENSCHFDNLVSFSKMSQKSDYCFSLTHDSNLKPNFYHQLSWMLNMKNCWEQPRIFSVYTQNLQATGGRNIWM